MQTDPKGMRNLLIVCAVVFVLIIGLACWRHFSSTKKAAASVWMTPPAAVQMADAQVRA